MKTLSESLVALAVLLVLFLKIDPFHWLMPNELQMLVLCLLTAALALYAGAVFREKPKDERENNHLYRASRWGYLVGLVALSVLVVVRDIQHELDPWLLGILGMMVVAKLAVLKWAEWKH
jgi:hypothetical protein